MKAWFIDFGICLGCLILFWLGLCVATTVPIETISEVLILWLVVDCIQDLIKRLLK